MTWQNRSGWVVCFYDLLSSGETDFSLRTTHLDLISAFGPKPLPASLQDNGALWLEQHEQSLIRGKSPVHILTIDFFKK